MRCARCGKRVSLLGVDCTYCGADKSESQALWLLGVICAGAGLGLGLALGGVRGMLLGGLLGGVVCAITQVFVNRKPDRHMGKR